MELVPKIPTERVIRGVQLAAVTVVMGLALSTTHGLWKLVALAIALLFVRPIVRSRDLAIEGALDRLESVLVLAARSVSVAALFAYVLGGPVVRVFGVGAFAFALVLAIVALARARAR